MLGRLAQDDRELLRLDPTVADALYRSPAELELERLAGELAEAAHDPDRLHGLERAYDDALTALSAAEEPDRALIADLLGELGLRSVPESRRMSELSGGQRRLDPAGPGAGLRSRPAGAGRARGAPRPARTRPGGRAACARRRRATVLVSHDRALLDVATRETLDLSDGRCDLYAGAYTFYLEERPKLMERLQGEYERAVAEVKRQEQVFFQYREWARLNSKFASRARARLTLLERARSRVERPEKRRDRTLSVSFASDARGRVMAEATGAEVSYSESVRIGPVDLVLERGDRVALIGPERRRQVDAAAAAGRRAGADRGPGARQGRRPRRADDPGEPVGRPRAHAARRRARRALDGTRRRRAPHLRARARLRPLPRSARPALGRPARARPPSARLAAATRPAAAGRADELHRHALGGGRAERARGLHAAASSPPRTTATSWRRSRRASSS